LLQAQGFNEGNQTIWIQRKTTQIQQEKLTRPTPKHGRQVAKATLAAPLKAASKPATSIVRSQTTKRWVPKKTLQAQGYYEGSTNIWLSKMSSPTPKPSKEFCAQSTQLTGGQTRTTDHPYRPIIQAQLEK